MEEEKKKKKKEEKLEVKEKEEQAGGKRRSIFNQADEPSADQAAVTEGIHVPPLH